MALRPSPEAIDSDPSGASRAPLGIASSLLLRPSSISSPEPALSTISSTGSTPWDGRSRLKTDWLSAGPADGRAPTCVVPQLACAAACSGAIAGIGRTRYVEQPTEQAAR